VGEKQIKKGRREGEKEREEAIEEESQRETGHRQKHLDIQLKLMLHVPFCSKCIGQHSVELLKFQKVLIFGLSK